LGSMNTTFDILVIVLSSLLGIFLIIAIVTGLLVYKLVKALRSVVAKGEHLVDSAEDIGEALRRNAGAVGMVRMLMKFISKVK
jgi:ethanolamine transporter EutH